MSSFLLVQNFMTVENIQFELIKRAQDETKGMKMKVPLKNKLYGDFRMARKTLNLDEYSLHVIYVFRSHDPSDQHTCI